VPSERTQFAGSARGCPAGCPRPELTLVMERFARELHLRQPLRQSYQPDALARRVRRESSLARRVGMRRAQREREPPHGARRLLIFFAHEFGRSGSKSERAAPSAPQMPDTRSSPQRRTRPVPARSPRSHPRRSRTSLSLAPRGSTLILTAKTPRTPRQWVNSFITYSPCT
jgi:hypothetical protein